MDSTSRVGVEAAKEVQPGASQAGATPRVGLSRERVTQLVNKGCPLFESIIGGK